MGLENAPDLGREFVATFVPGQGFKASACGNSGWFLKQRNPETGQYDFKGHTPDDAVAEAWEAQNPNEVSEATAALA